jgi:hypothetical protein
VKTCARCKVEKPVSEFRLKKNGRPISYCHPCSREYQREWQRANPELVREQKRRYREEHPEEVREAKRLQYQRDLEKAREYQRKRRIENPEAFAKYAERKRERTRELGGDAYYKYGITIEQRRAFEERQGGLCVFCDKPLAEVRVDVDHDHATGLLRGLLCMICNNRLGWYENRRERIAQYLAGPHVVPGAQKRKRQKSAD